MIGNTLGEILKARRLERDLTLQDLSALTRVHTSYLGRIERNERHPSASIVRKLAEPLGFTEVELFKLAGYLSPDQTDDRIARLKSSLKQEIAESSSRLMEKVDSL